MADEEIIGGIGVTIGADYSSLTAAFSIAQDLAQTAGGDIADALAQGGAAAADLGTQISDGLEPVAGAATEAAGGLDDLATASGGASDAASDLAGTLPQASAAAEEVGASGHEGASGLAEMAEQMAAVGEALVITEGMTELGSEALSAADNITRATIALTNLTGSGEKAQETIESLDQLGTADGLTFPSLLTAGTRMQAILGPGADVTELLKGIADGASVMGTDITAATTRFDQMATAGNASARTLTSLGLSLSSLATAINAINPAADATASSAAAMFKALDQADRITVLEQALSVLGGTAEKVAEQTFGGQWTQLANEWEAIMVQVGQAILPVISDILQLTKTDIIPFIAGVVDGFNSLDGPMKDLVVGLALATAAIIPVTGGLAALGLAVGGLSELMPALTGLMGAFGLASEAAGEEAGAAAGAAGIGAVEVSAEAAGIAVTGLSGFLAIGLVAAAGAAAIGLTDLRSRLDAASAGFGEFSQTNFTSWVNDAIKGLASAQLTTDDATAATAEFKTALDLGVISGTQYTTALKNIALAQADLAKQNLAAVVSQYADGLTILTGVTQKATDQQSVLLDIFTKATAAFETASVQYAAGVIGPEKYQAAVDKLTASQKAFNDSMGPTPTALDAINKLAVQQVAAMGGLADSQTVAQAQSQALNDKLGVLAEGLITAQQKLVTTTQAVNDGSTALAKGQLSYQNYITLQEAEVKASQAVTKAQTDYNTASDAADVKAKELANTFNIVTVQALQDLTTALGPAMAKMLGLYDAMSTAQAQLPDFGVTVTALSSGPLTGLQGAFDEATAKVAKLAAEMAAGQNVGQQYEKALTSQLTSLVNLNVATAEQATGLQGATDAYSLAIIAVAAAQAKYDTLNQAYQTNITLAPQVDAAAKALTTAQNNLAGAANNTALGFNSANQSQLVFSQNAPAAVKAMGNITTAAQATATAVQNVTGSLQGIGAVIDSIEAGLTKAMGLTGQIASYTAGGTYATQPGVTGSAGTLYNASNLSNLLFEQEEAIKQWIGETNQGVRATAGTSTTTSNSGVLLNTTGVGLPTASAGGSGVTASTSTGTVTAATGSGTSAVDGGSYPAVTAHQASGETWSVTTGTATAGGTSSSSITQTISSSNTVTSDTASGAVQAVATAVGSAAQAIATNSSQFGAVTADLASVAASITQIATAVSGAVTRIATGSTVTSQAPATYTGSSGQAYSVGTPSFTSASGNPTGTALPVTSAPVNNVPGFNPFGPGSTVNPQVFVTVNGASNPQAVANQVQSAVTQAMVDALRTAGARF